MIKKILFKLKRRFIFFVLVFILPGFQWNYTTAQDYQLVWSDEFEGSELDQSKWEHMLGDGTSYGLPSGWGNNELEYYRKQNATVQDGYLTITAKEEQYQGKSYTSSRIRSKDKGDWKYGKFEIRAKMPVGKGIWPALWMMPTDNVYGGWAASGEIDITEYLGHEPEKIYGTLHYGGSWPNNTSSGKSYSLASGTFHEDFHTFTLVWEEGKIQWFVDGERYQTQTSWRTSGHPFPAPFDQRFHMIINLAVGGNWPGSPNANTEFPQELVVDYIRIYQKTTGVQAQFEKKPERISLNQNYPNPFNSTTIIPYRINQSANVKLVLFDLQGREIETLVNSFHMPGTYSVPFAASNISSGVYIYRLTVDNENYNRKLLLIK